jgi:hypothetical protein
MNVSARGNRAILVVFLATMACTPLEPRSGITLLVTNSGCIGATCPSQHILGFPSTQPNTPGGLWSIDLGTLTAPTACLTLPRSANFYIIDTGTNDTTTITWTTADGLALGTLQAQEKSLMAVPSTGAFVPATSPGWSVVFPGGTKVSPRSAC